ncbi:adhesin [Shewanella japonica]|uniref:Type I secretion C-terminal target domain-containing protein n=1 Tax=Shewanella japonica TaxID=93973 RepID=A0ABN4YK32_9GAMM|nr:adhesin [Shewanella japonica]ARD23987.1 hypothetical protein SJ2017_3746 [Shewanella japonica]
MIVDGVDVLYYVKIGSSIFAVANDGQWHAVTLDNVSNELTVHDVNAESIFINADSAPYIVVDQQIVLLPNSLLINSAKDEGLQDSPTQDSSTEPVSISSNTSGENSNNVSNSGLNYFYQIIQTRYNALIAQSGYDTQGDEQFNSADSINSLVGSQDTFLTLTLSANIEDANDGYLNQFEVPRVDINGQALDARNGQVLQLTLTDIQGQQIVLSVLVMNESWQVNGLDISTLAEGLITAEISAPTYQGEAAPATDQTIKDTLASITIEIEDNDNVINAAEIISVTIKGNVTNVEDGQTVLVTLTDASGHSRTMSTTVMSGAWQLDAQDLSDFDQGSLTATAEVIDIAGNPIAATTADSIDILANIDISVDTGNDEFVNRFEMKKLDFSGRVVDVEDGQTVTITITDINGQVLTFTTQVINGAWQIDNADIEALVDGELRFDVDTTDLAGNPASASTTVIKDTIANVTINVIDSDNLLNQQEIDDLNTIFGIANNIEDGQKIFITITDSLGQVFTLSSEVTHGIWSLSGLDASDLADGVLHLYAVAIDAEGNPAFGSNTIIKDTQAGITVDIIDNDGVINAAEQTQVGIQGSVSKVEDGQTVTVRVSDAHGNALTLTTTVINGQWSLPAQDLSHFDDGTLIVIAEVSDIAGNLATAATSMPVDTTAEISIDFLDNDGVINSIEITNVYFHGSVANVEDGQTVIINLTDDLGNTRTITTSVINGLWALPSQDLSPFDQNSLVATATVTDIAGNAASSSLPLPIDTLASISVEIIDNDGVINAAEMTQVVIQGTVTNVEDGQTVTVLLFDNQGNTLTLTAIVSNGEWQLAAQDLSSFDDGSLFVTAQVSDLAGNPATAATQLPVDILADINIDVDTGRDDIINRFEMLRLDFSGQVNDVEDGQSVTIIVTDSLGTSLTFTTTITAGNWQIDNADISSLVDGDIQFAVSTVDIAGNPASTSTIVTKDSLAAVTIEAVDDDNTLNATEVSTTTLRGEALNIEDGQNVLVWVTDVNGLRLIFNTTVVDGQWQLDNLDLSSLAEGELSLRALSIDVEGNPSIGNNTVAKDTLAEITVEIIDSDGVINAAEMAQVVIQGTVTHIEDGQTVTINLTDNQGHSLTLTAQVNGGIWQLPAQDLSGFDDGSLEVTATVNDIAGNPATATAQLPVDILADITVEILDNDGVINATEMTQVVIQGTVTDVEDNQTVTVIITDNQGHSLTLTTQVIAGVWQLATQDLSGFDDGSLEVTASVNDDAGNPTTATTQLPVDTTAVITINIIDNDDIINQTELLAVVVSGTVTNIETGQDVTVTLTDANNTSTSIITTVNSDGTWTISAQDLAALGFVDGILTASATATDVAGNTASATDQLVIDTQVTIDIDTGADGFDVGLFTYGRESSLSGTTTGAEEGQTVTLTLTDGVTTKTFTTDVKADGTWEFDETLDVDGLDQRISWQMSVSVTDLAGNTATDEMPYLDIPDDGYLYELVLNINNQTSTQFSFDIPNAELTLSTDQSFLLQNQSNGQDLSIVIAPNGLFFQVFRDGDNELVLEATLIGTELNVTLYQTLDNPATGNLSTLIRVEGLQTDTDGTTEQIITYAILHVKDTPELAIDDHFTAIEDTAMTGSITGNDYTIEGPLVVETVTFNGIDYPVLEGSPAVIDTGKGELTVLYNGFWRFEASDNLDNTVEQSISFDYTVTDFDGSIASATSTIIIADGAIGNMSDASFSTAEAIINSPNTDSRSFTISAGSDSIVASSVVFSSLSLIPLTALGLTSNGDSLSYILSPDAKTITASANGVTVFTLSLSAVSNGDDVDVTAVMTLTRPLDHYSAESLELATLIDANDIDGSHIDLGNLKWNIQDGNDAAINNIETLIFDETNLIGTPIAQTGQFDIQVGADAIDTLGFDIDQLPELTVGGEAIQFDLSADGLTLIAHTGDPAQPIFTIAIDNGWNNESDTLSHGYTTTLHQPFDQIDTDDINFGLFITDNDGDTTQATMTLTVKDDEAGEITGITVQISELPSVTPGVDNRASGFINISAKGDPIVDIKFAITDGDVVVDADNNDVTQNGSLVYWVISNDGATAEGQTADGTVVFRMSLPTDIHIDAESTAQIDFEMRMLGPIDNIAGSGVESKINVDVVATDSDNTDINAIISIDIYDGESPSLPSSLILTIDEGELVDNNSVLSSAVLNIDNGSDDISSIEIDPSFTFGAYTSSGQSILLSNFADGNGWYTAIRAGDSSEVFRVRFNANGKVEFEQFEAIDHPDGNGENTLTISFDVIATDADGDTSNSQTIHINVQDDVPIQHDSSLTFTEENNADHSVNLFNQKQQGADGAQVSKFIYKGTEYSAGDSVELFTDTGVKYGTLVITANGKATVTSMIFEYDELFYSEVVQVYVTDTDGDTVIDNLTITANDKAGSIKVLNPNYTEDTPGALSIVALPGDIDEGEIIQSIVINKASLAGGTLTLDGQPVSLDADGNYILSGGDLLISNLGIAIPSGDLVFHPPEDASDATLTINAEITVNINNKPSISTEVPLTIASVADTPEWENTSQFTYDVNEDDGAFNISLSASTKDVVGIDAQGSEVMTYVIFNIALGIQLTSTNSEGVQFSIANGQEISADELALLQATVGENLAGQYSFDVRAISTEPDNGDTAQSPNETITINVTPIADAPTLVTRDINGQEDQPIALNTILFGELTDTSSSESLHFELTLPDGWQIDAPSAIHLGNNVWTVSVDDLFASPEAMLVPLADASSANLGDFTISVRSFATETTQDGIDPVDSIINPNPNYSAPQTITIALTGVANDAPTITSDPTVWEITNDGNINSVAAFNEDTDIPLSFTVISSDVDGSESLSLRIVGLPDGANFVDSNGQIVNLPVVGFDGSAPIYSVTAAELSALSIRPAEDFSGQINLQLFVESTELDGDSAQYELNLNIDIAPVIDETSATLTTTSNGKEDQPIVLSLIPALLADIDGSESITDMTIFPSSEGIIYLFDGAEITVGSSGLLLSELTDEFSPTLIELLNSGRLAVLPPQDADGTFSLDVIYQITDTSDTGETSVQDIASQLSIEVDAVVEGITRLQVNNTVLYSPDGQPITIGDDIVFFDGDIDGSEVLDYIVITMPSADGWYITHPNGAINDGDGRWIIPSNNMTSDSVQEQSLAILEGMTISSDHITLFQAIHVEARVLDRDDPEVISANIFVTFDQPTSTSTASTVTALQSTTVDATEDNAISFAGHLNLSITSDNNDVISFRVLASDLPQGGYFSGSDVIALYDTSGENVIEYVFTTASLSNLTLHNVADDFAGDMVIPIRIIATDSLSGDTLVDDSQSLDINISPIVDGLSLDVLVDTMDEDDPTPLGLFLTYEDLDPTADNGGVEKVVLDDPAQSFTIQLLDGGQLIDNSGLFQLKSGTTDTWEFTGSSNAALNSALALLQFSPPEHLSGDFRLQISGAVSDTADIDSADVIDTTNFSNTITIHVNPVTDAAEIPAGLITINGLEDTDILLSGINSSVIGLIDRDGSEVQYITLNGVPEGATVYYQDAGGDLHILPNNDADGGQLNGTPTTYWTVTPDQLDSIVVKPPHNFNGDMPLSLSIITQELGTDDFVTTSMDFIVGVSPIADGVQIISAPDDYTGNEGDDIKVEIAAELLNLDGSEFFVVDFLISSSDTSALVDLEGVEIDGQFVALTANGSGGYIASLIVEAVSLAEVKILPGELAFGTLNVEMAISSIDTAEVLGSEELDRSQSQTVSFDIELTPEVDPPIWTQFADFTTNQTDNIALNLGLELQNPAPNETATLTILGLSDGMTLSKGEKQGNKWIVNIEDVAGLTLSGATDGETITLSLDPIATLGSDVADGELETITITVDSNAVVANAFAANTFAANAAYASAFNMAMAMTVTQPTELDNPIVHPFYDEAALEMMQLDIMQEMHERAQFEQVRHYEHGYRNLTPTATAVFAEIELMEQTVARYQHEQSRNPLSSQPIDAILPIDEPVISDDIPIHQDTMPPVASNDYSKLTLDSEPDFEPGTEPNFEPESEPEFQPEFQPEPEPLLSGKPEYGYQDPQPITDAEAQTVEPIFSHLDNNLALLSEMSPVAQELLEPALPNEGLSTITIEPTSQLSIDMQQTHSYDKLIQQPGFDEIQPIPDDTQMNATSENQTEAENLLALTDAIKQSIAHQQDTSLFDVQTDVHLSQTELDEINQLAAHQALLNQS